MHGFKRIFVFCLVTTIFPAILIVLPLYLRHSKFADVHYKVAESDIFEIRDGISSVFCERHSLRMNTSFNAFQLTKKPAVSEIRKHIRLRKSMILPDDTLEYWGFYLLKGATVTLRVCSRYDGSRILVVKGDKDLKTCGLLEHNKNKVGLAKELGNVYVTFETNAEVIVNDTVPVVPDPEDDDGLGIQFEVPKLDTDERDDDDASEREDDDDDDMDKSTKRAKGGRRLSIDLEDAGVDVAEDLEKLRLEATEYIKKRRKEAKPMEEPLRDVEEALVEKKHRKRHLVAEDHHEHHQHHDDVPLTSHEQKVLDKYMMKLNRRSVRRSRRDLLLERKVNHGGTALNFTGDASNSVSSFENNLLSCYDGRILLAQSFPPSTLCRNVKYLESGSHMVTTHDISSDGYYYYIFYSDNDNKENDINALFDIHKPTFLYANISESSKCYNSTNCTFPIDFLTDEMVIVEVPTRDGIEHEGDDFTVLISTCHPRKAVYVVFPIAVLFLILSCAFL